MEGLPFAVLVNGRLPETSFTQIADGSWLYNIPDENVDLLAIFLTGQQPLNAGVSLSCHLEVVGINDALECGYVGYIDSQKPSVFLKIGEAMKQIRFAMAERFPEVPYAIAVLLRAEPTSQVILMKPGFDVECIGLSDFRAYQNHVLQNFFNYIQSFVRQLPDPQQNGILEYFIPTRTANKWYENFKRKFDTFPDFWRTQTND